MSIAQTPNKLSPKLCLLLKTLLFLLCIYIKRVTAAAPAPIDRMMASLAADNNSTILLDDKTVEDREPVFDLDCPIHHLIAPRNASSKYLKNPEVWQQIRNNVNITWLKNGYGLRRENGNYMGKLDHLSIKLFQIGESDAGEYTCLVNYQRIPKHMREHLILTPALSYRLNVIIPEDPTKYHPAELRTEPPPNNTLFWVSILAGTGIFVFILTLIIVCVACFKSSILRRDKKQVNPLLQAITADDCKEKEHSRRHLPHINPADIYNTGKNNGFHHGPGHFVNQSICNNILDKKKNPSISSSNSQNSDEASSWGKSMSSHGDNSRAFYQHTSNATSTTVPLYDHPPSTGTSRLSGTLLQHACVINPAYGFLRPTNDAYWDFPRRNLDRLSKIGEGQFGEVWLYMARQKDGKGTLVAVKQLKDRAGLGDKERLELIAEIEIMKLVNNHPNVIKLLHYCVDDYQEPILLIMEYAEHGKLQTYLRNCRVSSKLYDGCIDDTKPNITSKELIKFIYHIAKGMEYVAAQGIIHRDLASRNILVSKDKICKVADFGFARRVNDECAYERTTANPVPVKWMAPEALVENKFTTKSDVYSFGILMWEIVTLGSTPYKSLKTEQVIEVVAKNGERPAKPDYCHSELYEIMSKCWSHEPDDRPTFKYLAKQLDELLLSENDYIKLDQYPDHNYYNIPKPVVSIELL